jgi:hypothetical protein
VGALALEGQEEVGSTAIEPSSAASTFVIQPPMPAG